MKKLCIALLLSLSSLAQAGDVAPALKITHGPMLGRPGARQMAVWARTSVPGEFHVVYTRVDPAAATTTAMKSPAVSTFLADDCTGWIVLNNLEPYSKYSFRVVTKDHVSPPGSFRTFPDPATFVNAKLNPQGLFNFRFEVGSCNNQGLHGNGPALPAFKTMLDKHVPDKILFSIMNGDWIYEEKRDFSVEDWVKSVHLRNQRLPRLLEIAPTLTGVWENYKLYLTRGQNLAEWHRQVPAYFTFDDHEILNDVTGCGSVGHRDRRAVFRDIALRGWYDYVAWSNPVSFVQDIHFGKARLAAGSDILLDTDADFTRLKLAEMGTLHVHWGTKDAGVDDVKLDKIGGDPNAGVYEVVKVLDKTRLQVRPPFKKDSAVSYSIGRRSYYNWRVGNCEFIALDTRSHRLLHDMKKPDRPDVSILGAEQRAWLKDVMTKSDAAMFFIVSSVPFMVSHDGASGMSFEADDKNDSWTYYLHEREELIRFWEKLDKPVMVLTGDLHNSFAVKISERVWEFCCSPRNSRNHTLGSEGKRPTLGTFRSGNRTADIRWGTFFLDDVPKELRNRPLYTIVQINNVFNNPLIEGKDRWIAYPRPQAVIQFHDGRSGELLYAEAVR